MDRSIYTPLIFNHIYSNSIQKVYFGTTLKSRRIIEHYSHDTLRNLLITCTEAEKKTNEGWLRVLISEVMSSQIPSVVMAILEFLF